MKKTKTLINLGQILFLLIFIAIPIIVSFDLDLDPSRVGKYKALGISIFTQASCFFFIYIWKYVTNNIIKKQYNFKDRDVINTVLFFKIPMLIFILMPWSYFNYLNLFPHIIKLTLFSLYLFSYAFFIFYSEVFLREMLKGLRKNTI